MTELPVRYVVPPYLTRMVGGFKPNKPEYFGDGGAFPESHLFQYPLDLGRTKDSKAGSNTLPVTFDEDGNVRYNPILKQNENATKIVYSQHTDLIPKVLKDYDVRVESTDLDAMQKQIETTQMTKAALDKIVSEKLSAAQPNNVPTHLNSTFVKYKPSHQSAAFNSVVVKVVEMSADPLEPPKFKHKKVPRASGSPPVTVMHSPPGPVTVKDQQDWKIAPCIPGWKNPKGYAIPLDKRLAADGRGLQDVQINDKFAGFSEVLCVAEQKAREAIDMRTKVQNELMMKEKENKDMELLELARKARSELASVTAPDDRDRRLEREKIREERRRERERERRQEEE